jgi:signal transduction histidine kinase
MRPGRRAHEVPVLARVPVRWRLTAGYLLTGFAQRLARIEPPVHRERALVADVSHELRTPLAILRAELELIAIERPTGQELQTAIDSAIDETDRLTGIADDLLLLARADHDGLVLERSARPVAELLEGAAGRGRHLARGTRTQITVDAAPELRMLVDPARIAQALDNLVANALRYARGHVELSARARSGIVELHVVDDGPGFPATFLPGAWERFARADGGRSDDGAGLGLSIVRAIAEAHDGHAHAANAAQGGADVWITLPALLTPRQADVHARRSRAPA